MGSVNTTIIKMKFKIKFISGIKTVAEVEGMKDVDENEMTMWDVQKLLGVEKHLEEITGLRVHIDYEVNKNEK